VRPIELGVNQLRRFYRGGARIAAFRGLAAIDDGAPEDWIASTTLAYGDGQVGLSRLPDGAFVRDAIADDPATFLGPAHVAAYGGDPALLVKLLDAGERLLLHLHPDAAFAQEHLGSRWGKTEGWIILEAVPGATVHVGFSREIGEDELERLVREQDVAALTGAMNRVEVGAGDSIFVPAGMPHVIGEGILLLELQEPSDLSLLLEWGRGGEAAAFLGLSRELALQAVDRTRTSPEELAHLQQNRGASFFPSEADGFFRAERLVDGSVLEPSFAIVVVLEGEGTLETDGGSLQVTRGSTALVPHSAGPLRLTGACRAIA
jgi:mannose-6-phosphate isomerase